MNADLDHLLLERPYSDELVIFLSAMNVGGGRFNWSSLANSLSSHSLLLSDSRNYWYLDGVSSIGADLAATARYIEVLAVRLRVNSIFFVGSSMGAYGALRLSEMLKVPALAFSPEAVLDRPGSRTAKYRRGGMPVSAEGNKATVIFGESDSHDLWNAHHLAQVGATALGLHGVGHYASTALNQAGLLPALLHDFIRHGGLSTIDHLQPEPRSSGRWQAKPTTGTAVHDRIFVEAISSAELVRLQGAWRTLEFRAREAIGRYPISDYAHYLLGLSLLKQMRPAEAISSFSTAVILSECSAEYRHSLGIAFWRLGNARLAKDTQEEVLRRWPRHAKAQYALAMIDLSAGDTLQAKARLNQAIEWEPNHPSWKQKLAKITQ